MCASAVCIKRSLLGKIRALKEAYENDKCRLLGPIILFYKKHSIESRLHLKLSYGVDYILFVFNSQINLLS